MHAVVIVWNVVHISIEIGATICPIIVQIFPHLLLLMVDAWLSSSNSLTSIDENFLTTTIGRHRWYIWEKYFDIERREESAIGQCSLSTRSHNIFIYEREKKSRWFAQIYSSPMLWLVEKYSVFRLNCIEIYIYNYFMMNAFESFDRKIGLVTRKQIPFVI